MTPQEIIGGYNKKYNKEYKTPRLNIVTVAMDEGGDECDGRNKKSVMKYYTVRPKEDFTKRFYDKCNGPILKKYEITIQPRKFYNETQVMNYVRYINKIAGRTLEDDEMNLLLKTISRGRQYKLTCVMDITEELKDETVWRE